MKPDPSCEPGTLGVAKTSNIVWAVEEIVGAMEAANTGEIMKKSMMDVDKSLWKSKKEDLEKATKQAIADTLYARREETRADVRDLVSHALDKNNGEFSNILKRSLGESFSERREEVKADIRQVQEQALKQNNGVLQVITESAVSKVLADNKSEYKASAKLLFAEAVTEQRVFFIDITRDALKEALAARQADFDKATREAMQVVLTPKLDETKADVGELLAKAQGKAVRELQESTRRTAVDANDALEVGIKKTVADVVEPLRKHLEGQAKHSMVSEAQMQELTVALNVVRTNVDSLRREVSSMAGGSRQTVSAMVYVMPSAVLGALIAIGGRVFGVW